MDVSLVIPVFNEEESLTELSSWIEKVMAENKFSYEAVMVDDGSSDDSWTVIKKLSDENKNIRGIKLRRNYGKSAALYCGFAAAKGDVVITMDADLQDSPDEIPGLVKMIKVDKFDMVSGWKKNRVDPAFSKTFPSRVWNYIARVVTGIKLHDMNCGLKAYKNQVVKSIEVYGEMHRYIPVLAKKAGYSKIGEKEVVHRKRKYGVSKYGIERFIKGILDLLSIMFISKFGKRPMHLFGSLGIIMFVFGFLADLYLGALKLYSIKILHVPAKLITDNPYFYISLAAMIIGTQLFLAGFLAELISRSSSDRNKYLIESEVNFSR